MSFAQAPGFAIWILLVRKTACIPGTISVLRKIAKVVINPKMWEDTIELDSRTYNELEMIKDIALTSITRADIDGSVSVWASDATETTIAICCGAFSSAKSVPFHHIFQNELDAALWAVREAAKSSKSALVFVDNTATLFALRAKHSVNAEADEKIAKFFLSLDDDFHFQVRKVRTENNPADIFTRGGATNEDGQKSSFSLKLGDARQSST